MRTTTIKGLLGVLTATVGLSEAKAIPQSQVAHSSRTAFAEENFQETSSVIPEENWDENSAENFDESSCMFKKENYQGEYRGFKIPEGVNLKIPLGTIRYTFVGRDPFPGQNACRFVVDARQSDTCGAEIIEARYEGRSSNSWGPPEDKSDWWLDFTDLLPPYYYGKPHLIRPGMTIRSIPGMGGILVPYAEEYKFFGESIDQLKSFEHLRPIFPLAWQKIVCNDLELVDQKPISTDPYAGIPDLTP